MIANIATLCTKELKVCLDLQRQSFCRRVRGITFLQKSYPTINNITFYILVINMSLRCWGRYNRGRELLRDPGCQDRGCWDRMDRRCRPDRKYRYQ